ncbi:signal peptidase II [Sphingomonas immobilis]|uniref:Lipoprotein signal peptidase n=1 Tax=Sphingomonas immobilis TaxID=3063997 RepID=A0ABT9A514_9SPHN|nr:signal peptidase II [Sphingomonas sp. CA1-15]MDO7844517.1 signal peptidase II [Sphingomonas sp. CA1-15]
MSKLPIAGLAAALVLFVADQAAKYGVTEVMGLNELTLEHYVTSFFNIRFVANRGVSLGLLHADSDTMRWALVVMTGLIAGGVLVWMLREKNRVEQIALGSVLGGALGNILDRVRLGYVVDFLDFHIGAWQPFLVFNTADVMITMGVLVLFARALLVRDKPRAERASVENSNA